MCKAIFIEEEKPGKLDNLVTAFKQQLQNVSFVHLLLLVCVCVCVCVRVCVRACVHVCMCVVSEC